MTGRFVAIPVRPDGHSTFFIYLRDTKLKRWVTLDKSASPEPTFRLSADEQPAVVIAADYELLAEANHAMLALAEAFMECAADVLRSALARTQPETNPDNPTNEHITGAQQLALANPDNPTTEDQP